MAGAVTGRAPSSDKRPQNNDLSSSAAHCCGIRKIVLCELPAPLLGCPPTLTLRFKGARLFERFGQKGRRHMRRMRCRGKSRSPRKSIEMESHMKKSLIVVAVAASFASVAHAQSSVTLYGLLDAGLTYTSNVAHNAKWAAGSGGI